MTPMHVMTNVTWLAPFGGIEGCTLQDSTALVERGHRVDVVYGSDGSHRPAYEAAGVRLYGPARFVLNPWLPDRAFRSFLESARMVASAAPELLWLSRSELMPWAQFVARYNRIPLVCHLHQVPNFRGTRLWCRGVAHFVAVSEFIRRAWIAAGIAGERITTVPNAIPMERYPAGGPAEQRAARAAIGLPQGVPVVLYYGQVSTAKGVQTLAHAWRALGLGPDEARLVLLGHRGLDPDPGLEKALADLGPGAYQWFENRSEVVPFLHAADLVVMPSLLAEAFGRVVIETMATGRPVIASDVGGVPEILTGALARFLVPPGEPGAWAAAVRSLLHWRRDEPDLGEVCRAEVKRRFPFDAHVDALERVLRRHRRSTRHADHPRRSGA